MAGRMATTRWSRALEARDGSETEGRRALEELCKTYWQPLYAYIRHQGWDAQQAEDLTQAFFAELLEKKLLGEVDPSRGRFRSFLVASLRNFLSHERDRSRASKRGGGRPVLSVDLEEGDAGYALRPVETMTPEALFERRWAMAVLDRALARLGAAERADSREAQFEELKQYLTGEEPRVPYREVAEALGMSEEAVATAVHRLRKRYGVSLRDEIGETVADTAQVDDELRHLLAVVRR